MKLSCRKVLFDSQSLAADANSDAMDVSRARNLVIQISAASSTAVGVFYPAFRESADYDFVRVAALGVAKSSGSGVDERIEIPDSCCAHEMRLEYASTSGTGTADALASGRDD